MTVSNRAAIRKTAGGTMTASQLAGLGMLNPEQSQQFIRFMTDDAVLLQQVTTRTMKEQTANIDYFAVGGRQMRAGTERVVPLAAGPFGSFTRKQLVALEAVLPVDITFNFVEDNLEKENGEEMIVQEIARLVSNDTEDLGLHGDITLPALITDTDSNGYDDNTGLTQNDHTFLSQNEGWFPMARSLSLSGKVALNAVPASVSDWKDIVFPAMLGNMPEKYKRNVNGLVFLVSPTTEEQYRQSLQSRNTILGDAAVTQQIAVEYMGIPVLKVPYITDARDVMLTNTKNLVYGIYRQIRVGRFVNERERQVEYTVSLRNDFQITNDALMVVTTHGL